MLEEVASGVNHMHALELALLYKQKATAKAREPGFSLARTKENRFKTKETGRAHCVGLVACVARPTSAQPPTI